MQHLGRDSPNFCPRHHQLRRGDGRLAPSVSSIGQLELLYSCPVASCQPHTLKFTLPPNGSDGQANSEKDQDSFSRVR
jgi:hypothetical protein